MSDNLEGLRAPDAEPDPAPNGGPSMHDLAVSHIKVAYADNAWSPSGELCALMEARKEFGLAKYDTPLQANNGRNPLKDALDETLDLIVYLQQAIAERPETYQADDIDFKLDEMRDNAIETAMDLIILIRRTS